MSRSDSATLALSCHTKRESLGAPQGSIFFA